MATPAKRVALRVVNAPSSSRVRLSPEPSCQSTVRGRFKDRLRYAAGVKKRLVIYNHALDGSTTDYNMNDPSPYVVKDLADAVCWKCNGPTRDTGERLAFENIRHAVVYCRKCKKETHVRIA